MADALQALLVSLMTIITVWALVNILKTWIRPFTRNEQLELDRYVCRLLLDMDQIQYHSWLCRDTRQNVIWVTGDMYGYPVDLRKLQNAPHSIYPHRFPSMSETDSIWKIRAGKLLNTERFLAVLIPKSTTDRVITFGYIECLFVDCQHLNGRIGWLYNVYVAPEYRQHGLGTALIKHSLQYYKSKRINDVYLCVIEENTAARRLYQKCGFQSFDSVVDSGHNQMYLILKYSFA